MDKNTFEQVIGLAGFVFANSLGKHSKRIRQIVGHSQRKCLAVHIHYISTGTLDNMSVIMAV